MSHDDYDDGLVHSHSWASQTARTPGQVSRRAEVAAATQRRPDEAEFFDDGLVHAHNWACSERNRMPS